MPDVLEAPAPQKTADEEAEVAALLAMLEGEPACDLATVTMWTQQNCFRPAQWIGRLVCEHPFVCCDYHHRDIMSEPQGAVQCPCGEITAWAEGLDLGDAAYSNALDRVIVVNTTKPNMLPL